MKKHLVFIVNPRSGVDRTKRISDAINSYLDQSVFSYEIRQTEYAGHGETLAREAAANKVFAVVAVGGDGSVNDAIRGLYGTDTVLAIIPKGSGNGLARTLDIPMEQIAAIQLINTARISTIDVGKVNDHLFASNAGVGFDTLVCEQFAHSRRRGLLVYIWLIIRNLWVYKEPEWLLEINGKTFRRRAFIINVANGSQLGYNFKIAPDANWRDGLLDVVIIHKFPRIMAAVLGYRMFRGTILKSRYVERIRTSEIRIAHPQLSGMQIDGDFLGCAQELLFSVQKQRLKILVP